MNDNQITDDLLEELEELESSATQMDKQLEDTEAKQKALDKLDPASTIDATSMALETAKMAQEAASHSQKAAEASLNHASRQKEQIMELSDANFSWRQAVKSANKELNAAKSQFAVMLGISIVTSITAMSVMGWLLYNIQQKEADFKGEVLDILQTENALLTKKITIKVDELSGLIELMTADIQKITKLGMSIRDNTANNSTVTNSVNETTVPAIKESNSEAILDLAIEAKLVDQNEQTDSSTVAKPHEINNHNVATPHVQTKHTDEQHTSNETHTVTAVNTQVEPSLSTEHYSELKSLIENILNEQKKLQATTMAPSASHGTANLTTQQEKQLKDISWLVRKQSKTLEQIKQTLNRTPSTSSDKKLDASTKQAQQTYRAIQGSLIELKDQLGQLRDQQNQLQSQVDGLQKETKKLSDAAQPYSYQLKQ